MIFKLRTIAILMLLAGLSLGIFASRALRAMGGPADATAPVSGGQAQIELRVDYYQRDYRLTPQQTDRLREALYRHDRLIRDKYLELRQQPKVAAWFDEQTKELNQRVSAILAEAENGR